MNLSILDVGSINFKYEDVSDVYNTLFSCVELCDELGFKRYWLTEHYSNDLAWNKPDMILPLLLANTENINIGVAGILYKYREAYRTACDFNILSALFPDRIDLGLSSGVILPNIIEKIGVTDNQSNIGDWCESLLKYYTQKDIWLTPSLNIHPNIWTLGSGGFSLEVAKTHNLDYCFSISHPLSMKKKKEEDLLQKLASVKSQHAKTSVLISGCVAKTKKQAFENYQKCIDINGTHPFKDSISVLGTLDDFYKKAQYIKSVTGVDDFVFMDMNLAENKEDSIKLLGELIR